MNDSMRTTDGLDHALLWREALMVTSNQISVLYEVKNGRQIQIDCSPPGRALLRQMTIGPSHLDSMKFEGLSAETSHTISAHENGACVDTLQIRTLPAPSTDHSSRFAIVSDPHVSVGRPSYDGRLLENSRDILRGVLQDLGRDKITDVLMPGDITDRGLVEEYEAADKILSQFGGRIFAVPGDHDAAPTQVADSMTAPGLRRWDQHFPVSPKEFFHQTPAVNYVGIDTSLGGISGQDLCRWRPWILTEPLETPLVLISHFPVLEDPYLRDIKKQAVGAPH